MHFHHGQLLADEAFEVGILGHLLVGGRGVGGLLEVGLRLGQVLGSEVFAGHFPHGGHQGFVNRFRRRLNRSAYPLGKPRYAWP